MLICKLFSTFSQRAVSVVMSFFMGLGLISVSNAKIKDVPEKSTDLLRVISFNLRYADDNYGKVENRSKLFAKTMFAYAPDSFGVQEATDQWLACLDELIGEKYARVGEKRDQEEVTEYNCVFYLKDKYDLLDSGTFWLSETPDEAYSMSFDTACARICTWAKLKDKETGFVFIHANTHLDNVYEETRYDQVQVVIDEIKKISGKLPVVYTGDFNSDETEAAYKLMTETADNARLSAVETEDGLTWHDYGNFRGDTGAVDFIFVPKGTKVERYKIIDTKIYGMFISDHYGICADIDLQ